MLQGYYAEHVIRDRERERVRRLHGRAVSGVTPPWHERAVLSADLYAWTWRRAGAILGVVGTAMAVTVVLPATILGFAWGLREVLQWVVR